MKTARIHQLSTRWRTRVWRYWTGDKYETLCDDHMPEKADGASNEDMFDYIYDLGKTPKCEKCVIVRKRLAPEEKKFCLAVCKVLDKAESHWQRSLFRQGIVQFKTYRREDGLIAWKRDKVLYVGKYHHYSWCTNEDTKEKLEELKRETGLRYLKNMQEGSLLRDTLLQLLGIS